MKTIRLALAIIVAALMVVPLLPSVKAPPLAPYEAWGIARNAASNPLPLGTPIRTFIDGVDYSNLTVTYRADGSYQTQIAGNWYIGPISETPAIKEGGDPNDPVMFADSALTTGGTIFAQDATWQTAFFQNLDLQYAAASAQPALLKICSVTTQPADLQTQYAYVYNPTGLTVDLSNFQFQKDVAGNMNGPTVSMTGTVAAGKKAFVDLGSTSYLTTTGDALKLVYKNTGGTAFNGRPIIADRVEFNATSGGTLSWEPGNTIMTDAPAPGLGQEIHRTPDCATDTNQGTDFVIGPETTRPTAPTVTVSSPNGGERWTGNSQHRIWWNMSDVQDANTVLTVAINYSLDSGTTYTNVIVPSRLGTANPNYYVWTVPRIDSTLVRVQVCATDTTFLIGCDGSDADFTIDSTGPAVITTTPTAGQPNVPLTTSIVAQFSEPMNKASVEAPGVVTINPSPGGTFVFSWNAANDTVTITGFNTLSPSTTYQVCIGTLARDTSDPGNYLIPAKCWSFTTYTNNAPSATYSAPVGGEVWSGGFPHGIAWTPTDDRTPPNLLVEYLNYTYTGGSGAISGRMVGNSSYTWTPSGIDATDVRLELKIFDSDGASATITSATFAIDSTPPSVVSTSPTEGQQGVASGASLTITFSEKMSTTGFSGLFTISPDPGGLTFNWAAGDTVLSVGHNPFAAGLAHTVTISGAKDVSNPGNEMPTFTLHFTTAAAQPPTVSVSAPAAGAVYQQGATITITWSMSDPVTPTASLKVYVTYTSSAGSGNLTTTDLTGLQTMTWTAPAISATDVVIHVKVVNAAGLSATADSGAFTIQGGGGLDVMTLAIIAIIIIVVVVVLLFFLLSKRRKKGAEEEEAPPAAEEEEVAPEEAPEEMPAEEEAPPPPPARRAAPAPAAAPAAGTKECPSCGTILDAKDAECFMCGHKF